eukprot:scaffold2789_cov277-Pinguiococcus_pyrenoidosus.AAC.1
MGVDDGWEDSPSGEPTSSFSSAAKSVLPGEWRRRRCYAGPPLSAGKNYQSSTSRCIRGVCGLTP